MRKEYDFSQAERGPVVPVPLGKTRITIRLDEDILEWFKHQVHAAGGGNYQTLINTALREYIDRRREPLEDTLRRVIREELRAGQGKASVPRIQYALPSSSVFSKYYNKDALFSEVDWSDWASVVDGFQSRFVDWYFEPLSEFPTTGHEAYPVLCTMCALVDAFAHYDGDREWHEKGQYQEFVRKLDPVFRTRLSSPIQTTRYQGGAWAQGKSLRDFADVFYAGVRCSLHHHGDLASFAGMSGTGVLARELTGAGTSTCGRTYPIVVFDPWRLRDTLEGWFHGYCADLRKNPQADRAKRFRRRFEADFAISIPEP